jgi:hypothetical protein
MQWQPGHYGLIPAGENTAREFVVMRTTDSGDALIRTLGDGEEIEFDMKQLHKISTELMVRYMDDKVELTSNRND